MSADARLFVALDLPASIRAELARWARWGLEPGEPTSAARRRGARASAASRRVDPTSTRAGPGRAPSDGIRRVSASALHVTLCFLGDQPLDTVDEIADVVESAVAGLGWSRGGSVGDESDGGSTGGLVGPLSIGAPVWLPPRKPRALALEIHDESGGLAALYEGLRDGLGAAIGWEPERRRLRPHVTVARLRSWAPPPACVEPTPALVFEPEAVTVYRSRLAPEGAAYDALVRVLLADGSSVHDE